MLDEDLALARELGRRAASLLGEGAGRAHAAASKSAATDLVTEYDRRSETLLVEALRAERPDDAILAEEGGAVGQARRRWLIDPLDGTTNFAHGLPFFCVSIGLEIDGVPTVGVVDAPALGWSFWASRGGGAWHQAGSALPPRMPVQLAVSRTTTLDGALLATGFPYDNATSPRNNFAQFVALYRRTQGIRRVGAAALDLCMVAAGWLDGYWEMKLQPWDLCAGALLVTEAGGRVTTLGGGPFRADLGEAVATNGALHDELVAALAASPDPLQQDPLQQDPPQDE